MASRKGGGAGQGQTQADDDDQPLVEILLSFSDLGRTVDGTGFAYHAVSCLAKKISSIKILTSYVHLQSIDLSQNNIKDVAPLKALPNLVRLCLADNGISSLKGWESEGDEGEPLSYLADLDLSGNHLPGLPPLPFKALKTVNFAKNDIATCQEFTGHERLEVLDLSDQRANKIANLAGLGNMPALTKLDVSGNELQDTNGLSELPALVELRLARNNFRELEGPWQELASLHTLDISGCGLEAVKPLEVLRSLPLLRTLEVKDNPVFASLGDNARIEVLLCHWRLSNLDGVPVAAEELESARQLNIKREEERRQTLAEELAAAATEEDDGS